MDLGSNTVLVTGGASGIGYALAERFLRAGSTVIICGRREDKLRSARGASRAAHPHRVSRVIKRPCVDRYVARPGLPAPKRARQ
jgi:short-subunit dehydrogenase involved in D-alanine esterification of teichoic acids